MVAEDVQSAVVKQWMLNKGRWQSVQVNTSVEEQELVILGEQQPFPEVVQARTSLCPIFHDCEEVNIQEVLETAKQFMEANALLQDRYKEMAGQYTEVLVELTTCPVAWTAWTRP